MRRLLLLACAFVVCTAAAPYSVNAQARVNISIDRSTSAFARANAALPQNVSNTDGAEAKVASSGGESSECRPYGRPSYSASSATVSVLNTTEYSKRLSFYSRSYANGGHYRTCARCFSRNCIGIHGNDTAAESNGTATATLRISLDNPPKRYEYEVSTALNVESGNFDISVTTPTGNVLAPIKDTTTFFSLSDRTPVLIIRVSGKSSASNTGGCCSQEVVAKATIDIKMEPAPQLNTISKFEPFIVGGRPTSSYPYVAAIGFKGVLHCTGTFIGQKTIVTAAHCVYGYENHILTDQFDVRFGDNFFMPSAKYRISSFKYPSIAGQPFYFNPKTFEDDIAVVILDNDPAIKPARLIASSSLWDSVMASKRLVNIVGFGFNVIDGGKMGLGVKREAAISLESIDNRNVRFANQKANTCNGDSGGPMFIETDDGQGLVLAAITSGGDNECTRGVNLRADAYIPWLSTAIK